MPKTEKKIKHKVQTFVDDKTIEGLRAEAKATKKTMYKIVQDLLRREFGQ